MFPYLADRRNARAWFIWACLCGCILTIPAHSDETGAVAIQKIHLEGRFSSLYEPSGIIALDSTSVSTRYLIVEDEPARALHLVNISKTDNSLHSSEEVMSLGDSFIQRQMLGRLDDLEGAARGIDNRLYVISSHDDAYKGRQSSRQKLTSFSISGSMPAKKSSPQRTQYPLMRKDLYASLKAQYPELAKKFQSSKRNSKDRLNVEALAFDRKRQHLLIGFRSPRLAGNAIVVILKNPDAYLQQQSEPDWADNIWTLDLEKGGLRAMSYDEPSDLLLLVSQRESGKSQRYKLWSVAADRLSAPQRIHSTDKQLFNNVEGLTSTPDGITFVRDDGNRRKKQGATWFQLQRQQLGIESQ